MIRTNCKIRQKCCKCCVDLEKEDKNLDYGTYYYADGERRQDVMEVTLWFPLSIIIGRVSFRKWQFQKNCNRWKTVTLLMSPPTQSASQACWRRATQATRPSTTTRTSRTTTTTWETMRTTTTWDSKGFWAIFKVSHIRKPVDIACLELPWPIYIENTCLPMLCVLLSFKYLLQLYVKYMSGGVRSGQYHHWKESQSQNILIDIIKIMSGMYQSTRRKFIIIITSSASSAASRGGGAGGLGVWVGSGGWCRAGGWIKGEMGTAVYLMEGTRRIRTSQMACWRGGTFRYCRRLLGERKESRVWILLKCESRKGWLTNCQNITLLRLGAL